MDESLKNPQITRLLTYFRFKHAAFKIQYLIYFGKIHKLNVNDLHSSFDTEKTQSGYVKPTFKRREKYPWQLKEN